MNRDGVVGLAGRAVRGGAGPAAARRPAAAGRGSRADGAAVRDPAARLRARAPAGGRAPALAPKRSPSASWTASLRWSVARCSDRHGRLPRSLRHPRQPRRARGRARRRSTANGIALLVLGDLVGYGGEPNGVIDRIRGARTRSRSSAAITTRPPAASTTPATSIRSRKYAAMWTGETLTADNREYLRGLPAGPVVIDERVEICHGSPFDEDHYIFDARRRAARDGDRASVSCACSATRTCRSCSSRRRYVRRRSCRKATRRSSCRSRTGCATWSTPARSASRATATRARRSRSIARERARVGSAASPTPSTPRSAGS